YHGGHEIWLLRLNNLGEMIWEHCYGGSGSEGIDDNLEVNAFDNDNFLVGASTRSNDGDVSGNHGFDDLWVFKLGPAVPTPVELYDFKVTSLSNTANLQWST